MERTKQVNPGARVVVPSVRVRESGEAITVPTSEHGGIGEPVIELVREGDVVRAIDITCPCGRRHRLLCEYDRTKTA